MQGTTVLLRSVANTAIQAPSRIPHLRFHISLRQGRTGSVKHHASAITESQRRCQSTVASSEFIERTRDTSEASSRNSHHRETRAISKNAEDSENISAVRDFSEARENANMFDILEEGLPDRILSGLMSESVGSPFIRQADEQLFKKALLALDPAYFVEPFKNKSRHLKGPRLADKLQVRTVDDRLAIFAAYLDRIVSLRRESGWKLDLEACNHLLKCAGSLGDVQLAESVLKKMMPIDGAEADLDSYNYYSQALVWGHAFSSTENYQLRVIPRNLEIRGSRTAPLELSGHSTSNKNMYKGIRTQILDTFAEVTNKGLRPNELTFTTLMVAMAREADMDGVSSILKSVWNIDVDLLSTYDEEELESPTFYEEDHPLRPSQDLLYSVAHVYGANNDIRTASLLVDFISRNYDLRVTPRVWFHLSEWAFVLSIRRSVGAGSKQARDSGNIPRTTFIQLVEVMMDEPHNIRPDAVTHFLLSRMWSEKNLDQTVAQIEKLENIVKIDHRDLRRLGSKILRYASEAKESGRSNSFASEEFYNLRHRYTTRFLEFQRSLQLMNVAVHRHLLLRKDWAGSGKLTEWERRTLPDMVWAFGTFLPQTLEYKIKTGSIKMETRSARYARNDHTHKIDYRAFPTILNALDTEDQAELDRRMEALPDLISSSIYNYQGQKDDPQLLADSTAFVLDPSTTTEFSPFGPRRDTKKEYTIPDLPFP